MIEIVGEPQISVGPLVCECCHAMCNRFPYHLMLKGMTEPVTVCKTCYRTALVIGFLKRHGGFEVIE